MHVTPNSHALVTGATGFVGSHLVRELLRRGYKVSALTRSTSNRDALSELPITWIEGELTDTDSLERATKNIDVVFHIAALFREAKFPDEMYWKVNLEGSKDLYNAASRNGVKRFVHCSTGGVHGDITHPPANEETPYAPGDVYQLSKCDAEKFMLSIPRDAATDVVVIRPLMIWGPGDKRLLKLYRGIKNRRMPIIGHGKTCFHFVLVTDLVDGFIRAAETAGVAGEAFLIGGARPVTIQETWETIARAVGSTVLPFRIPSMPIRILGALCEFICIPLGLEPPLHRRRVDFFTKTRSFTCDKAQRLLGYRAANSFEDEVKIIAAWYKAHGWL